MNDYYCSMNHINIVDIRVELFEDWYLVKHVYPFYIYRKNIPSEKHTTENNILSADNLQFQDDKYGPILSWTSEKLEEQREAFIKDGGLAEWIDARIIFKKREQQREWIPQALEYVERYSKPWEVCGYLSNMYRWTGKNADSYKYGKYALERREIWESEEKHLVKEDLSIVSYYVGDKEFGLKMCDELIMDKRYKNKQNVIYNRMYYLQEWKSLSMKEYNIDIEMCEDGIHRYNICNPSVVETKIGRLGMIRGINYKRIGDVFDVYHPNNVIISKNYLIQYDENWSISSQKPLIWKADIQIYASKYLGIEDIRLIDEEYFTGTILEITPYFLPKICLCHYDFETGEVDKIIPLEGLFPNRPEKNWLPFYREGRLYMIYMYQPFIIFEIDKDTGKCINVYTKEYNYDFSMYRGSAPPIEYELDRENGYLFTIHEVCRTNCHQYWNRYVWMTREFEIRYISGPFRYDNTHQIEMVTGISVYNNMVSGWTGVNDCQVIRYEMPKTEMDKYIKYKQII